ncbi:hypothetical protein BKP57_10220 [Virgibacillus sp. 6R]|nr:hypothetical protein BKP57_10220 [Virgibacillus sp. 6R]
MFYGRWELLLKLPTSCDGRKSQYICTSTLPIPSPLHNLGAQDVLVSVPAQDKKATTLILRTQK